MRSNDQDDLYRQASAEYGAALDRLVRAYELDPDKRRDLLQEIQLVSFESLPRRIQCMSGFLLARIMAAVPGRLRPMAFTGSACDLPLVLLEVVRRGSQLPGDAHRVARSAALTVLFIRHFEIRKMRQEIAALDDFGRVKPIDIE